MNWDWDKLKDHQQRSGPPPQFGEVFDKIKDFKLPGGTVFFFVILISFLLMTCFFTVSVDEVGVVQRFGRYVRTTQPGLSFKLPVGIETVTKVKIRRVFKMEFESIGNFQESPSRTLVGSDIGDATLMLTGDLNVAVVPWIVQYRIKDPYNYLFKVKNIEGLLSDLSEAAMRLVIGDRSINEVITKRDEIAVEAKTLLEAELENAEAGISIVTIEMKKTNVPIPVQPSFNEVNQAVQDKETMIYQAKEGYNKAIPEAKGEAERTIKAAEGYSLEKINTAKGDASRFLALRTEYAKAKDVTKRRMYLEMISEVFPKLGHKYIVDSEQKNMLPLLNLSKESGAQK